MVNKPHKGATIAIQPRIRKGAFLMQPGDMDAENFRYTIELIFRVLSPIRLKNIGTSQKM